MGETGDATVKKTVRGGGKDWTGNETGTGWAHDGGQDGTRDERRWGMCGDREMGPATEDEIGGGRKDQGTYQLGLGKVWLGVWAVWARVPGC